LSLEAAEEDVAHGEEAKGSAALATRMQASPIR
jgi:hypothetical protein